MRYIILRFTLGIISCCISYALTGQTATISGYVTEAASGETIIGANVYNEADLTQVTSTNTYGFYSLSLPHGTYKLVFSVVGYSNQVIEIVLNQDRQLNIELNTGEVLTEVVVTAEEADQNISSTQMGLVELSAETIKELPSLLGEADVLKAIQLLPGVSSASEGNTGFFVRGGGQDQNLVLLDEAVVYNSGHVLGFFSVFNSDAIKNTKVIKGGMPANYGGRLSSVVDIQMKEGNKKEYVVEGGIGLVASRITAQGPIAKDSTSSFMLSARRTYAYDLAQPFLTGSNFQGTNYYFYDFNAKLNHKISDKDWISLSGYLGRDVIRFGSAFRDASLGVDYGNLTGTFRWNHVFTPQWFANTSIIYNGYGYGFTNRSGGLETQLDSGVNDWNVKFDLDYSPLNPRHKVKIGLNYIRHKLTPNFVTIATVNPQSDDRNELLNTGMPRFGNEFAVYALDDFRLTEEITLNVGLRASLYNLAGPFTSLLTGQETLQGTVPNSTYANIEPRLSARFKLTSESSFKASFVRTAQYVHLASNSANSLPLDIWVLSTDRIKPQTGWQTALGYFQNFEDNAYEFSIEAYFRAFQNQIDYGETYVNDPTSSIESQFVFGSGNAYGLELFARKRRGAFNGWVSYTLSQSLRFFLEINGGRAYPAVHNRPHDLSVVLNYRLNPRWQVGGIFVYTSGQTYTPLESLFFIENNVNYVFGARNSTRLAPYHRFDFSATLTPQPEVERNFTSSWTFSLYNLYDRRNPLFIYYSPDTTDDGGLQIDTRGVSLFPIIPSVTWNFKWKPKKN
ncbi:MAG: TonB-dependent receptor [Bacteroidota bacterium]